MKFKEAIRKCEWIIPLVLIAGAFAGGSYYGGHKVESQLVSHTDTITKIVSVYKDFPKPTETAKLGYIPVPRYKFLTDTVKSVESVVLHDTTVVYLPRESKYYNEADGKLRLWISGYEPNLDRYELDLPETTITQTVTRKPSRFSIGVSVGAGPVLRDGGVTFGYFVGVAGHIAFWQF